MSNSSIYLHTGRLIDVLDIEKFEFTIDDFCHPLSMINRYTGNTKQPYSVAEHSTLGSRLPIVVEKGLARAFLLHDCSEVFVNDIPSPVKRQLPAYVEMEERIQRHIFANFDEPWENMEALTPYDKRMCQDEMLQVFDEPKDIGREPVGLTVKFWSWRTAKFNMRIRAKELGLV